ncbi:MAG TPA: hypothetical protein PKG48_10435 [Bacteroidales bacterium]|nr:hypothetical protein [Bacteroidales bacterium]
MEPVKLAYAQEKGTNIFHHVSENVEGLELVCPECGVRVCKKAKEIRRHHFSHHNTNCTATEESSLHKGAKYYLAYKLAQNQELELLIQREMLPEGPLKAVLRRARIPKIQLPVNSLFDNILCRHDVEKGIGGQVPDVLTTNINGPVMAWEIFVTHPMPPEKQSYFNENHIPYIELIPLEVGLADYAFEVTRLGNVPIVDPKEFTLQSLFNVFQDEFNSCFVPEIQRELLDTAADKTTDALFARINDKLTEQIPGVCLLDKAKEFIDTQGRIYSEQTYFKHVDDKDRHYEMLEDIEWYDGGRGKSPRFNKKAFIDSPHNLAGEFLKALGEKVSLLGIVDDKAEIIGLRMNFFTRNLVLQHLDIQPRDIANWRGMVNLSYLEFGREGQIPVWKFQMPDDAPEEYQQKALLRTPNELFYGLLKKLQEYAKIKITLGKGNKGYPMVFGIEVDGIYSPHDFQQCLFQATLDHIREILFPATSEG